VVEDGQAHFQDWSWDRTLDAIQVFDTTFVHNNVFTGDVVEHRQKKNLYRFIVGEKGVRLSRKEEKLKKKLKKLNGDLKDLKADVGRHIHSKMDISEFIGLEVPGDIESQIEAKRIEIQRLKEADKIQSRSDLVEISIPSILEEDLKGMLSRSLQNISEDAEQRVQNHIQTHLDERGAKWAEKGFDRYVDESEEVCPFCGQSVKDTELINAYRSYFDDEYEKLKQDIKASRTEIKSRFEERARSSVQKAISQNEKNSEFWAQHIDREFPELDFDDLQEAWLDLREAFIQEIEAKASRPLDRVSISGETSEAIEHYRGVLETVETYNRRVKILNREIQSVKQSTKKDELKRAQTELKRLQDKQTRCKKNVSDLCSEYSEALEDRNQLEKRKEEAKEASEKYTKEIFDKYQESINEYLMRFGARFKIVEIATRRRGKNLSSKYQIQINDEAIDLGTKNTPETSPRFGTALSTGDKHTLAFALFLSRLKDLDLDDKIVVFDDPVTSLDIHREENAAQEILRVASQAKQVIVLSHQPQFLHIVETHQRNSFDTRLLEIQMKGSGSEIRKWDKQQDLRDDYRRDYDTIKNFLADGADNLIAVIRAMRPLLERYLQIRFPDEVHPQDTFGDYINAIRESSTEQLISSMKKHVNDLEDVKVFTDPYMHGRDAGLQGVPSHNQVEAYAKRAIRIISS